MVSHYASYFWSILKILTLLQTDPPFFRGRQGQKCPLFLRFHGNCTRRQLLFKNFAVGQEWTGMEYQQNSYGVLAHQSSSLNLGCGRMLRLLWKNMWSALVLCRGMCIVGWGELSTPSYASYVFYRNTFFYLLKSTLARHAQYLLKEVEKKQENTPSLFPRSLFKYLQ